MLLLLSLVLESTDFTLNLHDFVILDLDQILDLLECVISLLHAEDALVPVFQKHFLTHLNAFNLDVSLFLRVAGRCSFLLLRDQLSLV